MKDNEKFELNYENFIKKFNERYNDVSIKHVFKDLDASSFSCESISLDCIYAQLVHTSIKIISQLVNLSSFKTSEMLDIGSSKQFVIAAASMIKCTYVESRIRFSSPVFHDLNLEIVKGEAQELPFVSDRFKIVTSLHAIEHFGLGRYGDNLDPMGDVKGLQEMYRVMKPGGTGIFCVPVTTRSREKIIFHEERMYSIQNFDQILTTMGFVLDMSQRYLILPGSLLNKKSGKIHTLLPIRPKKHDTSDDFLPLYDEILEEMIDWLVQTEKENPGYPTPLAYPLAYFVVVQKPPMLGWKYDEC